LADLAAGLGAEREAALCRELTKLHEEVRRGDLARLAETYAQDTPRGEIVLVIAPPGEVQAASAAEAEMLLRQALARVSLKDAVGEVADATGLPRRQLYQQALALTQADKKAKHAAPR
jgi:16S rRNA (cytidine1402-2'-O)-methyltransferase